MRAIMHALSTWPGKVSSLLFRSISLGSWKPPSPHQMTVLSFRRPQT